MARLHRQTEADFDGVAIDLIVYFAVRLLYASRPPEFRLAKGNFYYATTTNTMQVRLVMRIQSSVFQVTPLPG